MTPAIHIEGLGKRYRIGEHVPPLHRRFFDRGQKHLWALKDVSFAVRKGEVLGVIGRNGAGKTTLFRLIAGLTAPTEGTITRYGEIGTLLGLGLGVHAELTGRENIFMAGALFGMKKHEIKKHFDTIVEFSELEKFIDTPVKFYSSGMRSRLSFSTVMHLEHPDIMLIDEVLAAGDLAFRKKALWKLRDFAKSGRTVMIASHALQKLEDICDRCLYLDQGHVQNIGKPRRIVRTYKKDLSVVTL